MLTGYDELYSYDGLYRLDDQKRGTLNGTQTAITSGTFEQQWGLDSTGNWKTFKQDNDGNGTWELNQTRTTNKANEITGITNTVGAAWATPTYDPAGNMIGIPNPPSMTPSSLAANYDAWNRLVWVSDGATLVSQNFYDARGYRIRKDTYTSGTLTETRHYYYTPGWQCVEERTGTLNTVERQFVWGLRYIDDLVLRDRSTANNGVINERRYAMQDGNWNTIAICDITGFVSERYVYSAYGTPVFMTGAGVVQTSSPIGFETLYAGYRWDGATPQMYYVRNRFLLPMIGTWDRRDPLGYVDGTGLYEYVRSNPLQGLDPTGLVSNGRLPNIGDPAFPGCLFCDYECSGQPAKPAKTDPCPKVTCSKIKQKRVGRYKGNDPKLIKLGWGPCPAGYNDMVIWVGVGPQFALCVSCEGCCKGQNVCIAVVGTRGPFPQANCVCRDFGSLVDTPNVPRRDGSTARAI